MEYNQLLDFLKQYGKISKDEETLIKKCFSVLNLKKKQILINKNFPCNKLFFVNKGLLRTYYINNKGTEITRMIAWENRFITNLVSFKYGEENNETIECIENSEILCIDKDNFDTLLKSSLNLKSIYADILEEYNALHIQRFQSLNTFDLQNKFSHLQKFFPQILHRVNDGLLASFLGISRETYARNKPKL